MFKQGDIGQPISAACLNAMRLNALAKTTPDPLSVSVQQHMSDTKKKICNFENSTKKKIRNFQENGTKKKIHNIFLYSIEPPRALIGVLRV